MRHLTLVAMLTACGGSDPAMSWNGGNLDSKTDAGLGLIGVANLDDDDEDGIPDYDNDGAAVENDLFDLLIDPGKKGGTLSLTGTGVRLWRNGAPWMWDGDSEELDGEDEVALQVEFERPMDHGVLTFTPPKGDVLSLDLRAAPALVNHHLQATERVWALSVYDGAGWNNRPLTDLLTELMGDRFISVPGPDYSWDVWMQDEWEVTTTTAPDHRMDVVLDSIRDGGGDPRYPGLTNMPADYLEEPGVARIVRGSGYANTYDSTGNLEVSPPLGDEHPFGRIYYGAKGTVGVTPGMREFLAEQVLQSPIEIDTTWLCVGHVDEIMTFVPDPTAPRGFRFIYSDTGLGRALLQGMDGGTTLPRYRSQPPYGHGYATPAAILSDAALTQYNDRIQRTYLDPIREQMISEMGLTSEEVVLAPAYFEDYSDPGWGECGGLALVPGLANLLVINDGGVAKVVLPDPFLRTDSGDQSKDPMIAAWTALLPASAELHFVDDWNVYHMGMGEVHCGTNQFRTPTNEWWLHAAPTLEAN